MEVGRRSFNNYEPVRFVAPVLLNGWVNFGPDHPEAGFLKTDDGFVVLRGLVKNGPIPSDLFVLPAGFRPTRILHIATVSNGLFAYVRVFPDGTVDAPSGSATWFSLDGVQFDTRR
jgi:hypothetical protein